MKKIVLFNVLMLSVVLAFGQDIDELKQQLKLAKHDTIRCNILNNFIENVNNDSLFLICNQQLLTTTVKNLKTSKGKLKLFYKNYAGTALNNFGVIANNKGDVKKALAYFNISLRIYEQTHNKKGLASTLNNVGYIYDNKGDVLNALNYYYKSLKIQEEINDKKGMATALNNIAFIHKEQGDILKALDYYYKSLKIQEEIQNKKGVAIALINIGSIYSIQEYLIKALEYQYKALKIYTEIDNQEGVANALNNIGNVYKKQNQLGEALEYYNKSLKIRAKIHNKTGIIISLNNIGKILLMQNKPNIALHYVKKSLAIANELGQPEKIKVAANTLKQIYKTQGNYKNALIMYELETKMNDSINNAETKKTIIKKQLEYEYDKKTARDSIKNIEQQKVKNVLLKVQEAQLKQEKTKNYTLYGGLFLVVVFAGFMVNRFTITNKQKQIIEQQKHLVDEKHKEITDSVNYAERIQRGFLVTHEFLNEHLKISFIFFKPKDKVSGDFYWAGKASNGNVMVCLADSTGHGVPGAFMSLLNMSLLNEALLSKFYNNTTDILNFVRKILILGIQPNEEGEGGNDGMDCALFSINYTTLQLEFSGANNSLWIIRKRAIKEDTLDVNLSEIIELKGDKMSVGRSLKANVPFSSQTFQLQQGDCLYASTDGYADQFGGEKGKKFMTKQLKTLLLSIAHLPMEEQQRKLQHTFEAWKGDLEQVDDVCVMGIRI